MRYCPRVFPAVFSAVSAGVVLSACMPPAEADLDERRSVEVTDREISDAFFTVVEQLDLGGVFFGYIDIEEDIAGFAADLNRFIAEIQEHVSPFPPLPVDVEAIVRSAHLDGLRAVGLSSVRSEGLFRNSGFLYLPEGRQGVFRVMGGEPKPFAGLAYAPADTAFFYEIECDVPALTNVVTGIVETVMGDAGRNMIESWKEQPIDESGVTPGEVIAALDGRLSVALGLNPGNRLPIPGAGATFAEPELLVRAEGFGSLVLKLLGDNPFFVRSDEGGVIIFETVEALPAPFSGKHPIFLIEDGNMFFSLSREFLAENRDLDGDTLGAQEEFATILEALGGPEGNGLLFVRPVVLDQIRRFVQESGGANPEMASSIAILQQMLPVTDRPIASLRQNVDHGILFKSEWPSSHKQTMISGAYFNPLVLGLLSSMAIPAFTRVREDSIEARTDNDARQIAAAAQQYFLEENVEEVLVEYDPGTGEISGPLALYVRKLGTGYDRFPEKMTLDGEFVLGHPTLVDDRRYKDFGQYIGPSWE